MQLGEKKGDMEVQKVGIMIIFAPCDINSLNASGNARSQQISSPTLPIGVSKASCDSFPLEDKCGRSGCLHIISALIYPRG